MRGVRRHAVVLGACAILWHGAPAAARADPPAGVTVESVRPGFAAHQAGLRTGDILLGWERATAPPAQAAPAQGELGSPLDVAEVEIEQAPLGPVIVSGLRDGAPLTAHLPPGEWRLDTRP